MTIRGDRRPTGYLVDDDLARQRTLTSPTPSDPAGPAPPGDAAVATSPGEAAGPASPGDPAMQDAPLAPGHAAVATPAGDAPGSEAPADDHGATVGPPPGNGSGATGSQLRRFIKSRPWVPMHELRRRFGIEGTEDEMAGVDVGGARIYVGLPPREAALLADLIRQGEVGYELVHDPDCPAVAGVYPMRPVVRT